MEQTEKKYILTDETKEWRSRTLHRIQAIRDFDNVKKGDKGGWVESENNLSHSGNCWIYNEAIAAESSEVFGDAKLGGFAQIYDFADVFGHAKVYDDAQVFEFASVRGYSKVHGWAKIHGYAEVCSYSHIRENAQIFGHTIIHENAYIFGDAKIYGHAKIYGKARIHDDSSVFGHSVVCGQTDVFGQAQIDGNVVVCGYFEICGDAVIRDIFDFVIFKNTWSSMRYFTYTKSNKKWRVGCFLGSGKELIEKAYQDSERSGQMYEKYVKFVESLEN